MKVLFIATGNKGRLGFVFQNQLTSMAPMLESHQTHVVKGKGLMGYLANLPMIVRTIKNYQPDIIHAHYSFCGYLAALTLFRPIVVSLMGSDIRNRFSVIMIRLCHRIFWTRSIVKTQEMDSVLRLGKRSCIIPNGVDLDRFPMLPKKEACDLVGFDVQKKNVIFVADPKRPVKNFPLAEEAVRILDDLNVRLHCVYEVNPKSINSYMRAADALILTSFHEGSPNVIKEAMACDLPIVSTDIGDVRFNIDGLKGCFVAKNTPSDLAQNLYKALSYQGYTGGREKIISSGLDADSVRDKIMRLYSEVCKPKV